MSGLENVLFNLKFTTKRLNRDALKAGKEQTQEKAKLEKAMKQGHHDVARIHAQNAVRKQKEKVDLLLLASRVDAVASRVQTANTMRQITTNMARVNRSLDVAMKSMSPERVASVMMEFEEQFDRVDSTTELYGKASESATAASMPQDEIDRMMAQAADKVGVELSQDLSEVPAATAKIGQTEQEDVLTDRLRALRN